MKTRLLRVLRRLGLYDGPIHHRMTAKPGRIGLTGF